jgi:hypothetical protein
MQQDNSQRNLMNTDDDPVVEDANLPAMDDYVGANVMGVPEEVTEGKLMGEQSSRSLSEEMEEYPEMEPIAENDQVSRNAMSFAAQEHGEGYLRLVVEVNQGAMSVIDASVVDGPLIEEDLTGEMIYQALINDRRVGAGAFPDLSVQSGFAPPDNQSLGHSHTVQERFQFVARIPRAEITLAELANLEIELVKPSTTTELSSDTPAARGLSFSASASASGAEAPEIVARMEGVDLDSLSDRASSLLRSGLR